jgi:signal transduction histidine kinase
VRFRKPSTGAADVMLAALVGVPVIASAIAAGVPSGRTVEGALFGVAATVPLLFRRRWPFAVFAAVTLVAMVANVDGAWVLPVLIALYTIGSQRSWEGTIAAVAAIPASGVVVGVASGLLGGADLRAGDLIGSTLMASIAAGMGLYVGSKRSGMDALRERAERLQREQELLAERAVAEERVRIAQELHDVVAHNVSLIVVQAQALGATVPDPRVVEATDGIADLGRRAMTDMHRTLKLLRAVDGSGAEREPQPGLGDLDALLDRARAAGVPIDLAVEGEPRPLPETVDLSAFRIVQEALTNVVKHAGRARTTVMLSYRPDALELTITDSGNGAADPATGGHGLIGMHERAALFGGTLNAGPRDGHGFEVRASLPYGGGA